MAEGISQAGGLYRSAFAQRETEPFALRETEPFALSSSKGSEPMNYSGAPERASQMVSI
jgi:hypothetical protein